GLVEFSQRLAGLSPRGDDPFCEAPDGLFWNQWHCEQFFLCANGNGCLMTCDAGTHFHPTLKVCVWPFQTSCQPRTDSYPPSWPPLRLCSEIQGGSGSGSGSGHGSQ
ncbi:unnamed protein product, partial [Meganyctiphanes norvegica]